MTQLHTAESRDVIYALPIAELLLHYCILHAVIVLGCNYNTNPVYVDYLERHSVVCNNLLLYT